MARLMHAESWMLRIFNLDAEYILHGKKDKNQVLPKSGPWGTVPCEQLCATLKLAGQGDEWTTSARAAS